MRILVTGANGFIGKNLCLRLSALKNIDIVKYDIEDPFSVIAESIDSVDFIFHLAGVNRPDSAEEFYAGNTDFTKALVTLIEDKGVSTNLVFTSSIQAALENDYGKSKKLAEDVVLDFAKKTPAYVYRLHNVFGKWCRPNYNSVVATFCYNVMRGLPVTVNDSDRIMELVYIDDIVDEFITLIQGALPSHRNGDYCQVDPVYQIKLGELAQMIEKFSSDFQGTVIPDVGDDFTKKLFSTFVSYADAGDILCAPKINTDARGSFTELVNTAGAGQISVSVSKKGVRRGNHYHDTKMEKFIVLKGEARIGFRHMATGETMTFDVSGDELRIVNIPAGYTHNIENLGNDEMILLIWCNENFDPDRPDTWFEEV